MINWNLLYGDKIFSSTDLSRHSSMVLGAALKYPVTILRSGGEGFVLMERVEAATLVALILERERRLMELAKQIENTP